MAKAEVWSQSKDLLAIHVLGGVHHVAQVRFFVAQDDTKPLSSAFEMLASLRFLGAQIDDDATQHFPVTNGPVSLKVNVTNPVTIVRGNISNWHALDNNGTELAVADWKARAATVGFTLSGAGTVTLPIAQIVAAIPTIGLMIGAISHFLPANLPIEISYPPISIPVHRNVHGDVALPSNLTVPSWWR